MTFIKKSNLISTGTLLAVAYILIFINNHYVLTADFFKNNDISLFSGTLDEEKALLAVQKWVYILTGAYVLAKVLLITLILHTALFVNGLNVKFSKVLNVVAYSELIFQLAAILKICWFLTFYPHGTLSDWHSLYMLSALSLLPNLPADWSYVLQSANLFELAYWFLLAFGINKADNISFDRALSLVLVSYVPAFLVWVLIATFTTVLFFPHLS